MDNIEFIPTNNEKYIIMVWDEDKWHEYIPFIWNGKEWEEYEMEVQL